MKCYKCTYLQNLVIDIENKLTITRGTGIYTLLYIKQTTDKNPLNRTGMEKEMATYFCILAWRIPWAEEPAGYSP